MNAEAVAIYLQIYTSSLGKVPVSSKQQPISSRACRLLLHRKRHQHIQLFQVLLPYADAAHSATTALPYKIFGEFEMNMAKPERLS